MIRSLQLALLAIFTACGTTFAQAPDRKVPPIASRPVANQATGIARLRGDYERRRADIERAIGELNEQQTKAQSETTTELATIVRRNPAAPAAMEAIQALLELSLLTADEETPYLDVMARNHLESPALPEICLSLAGAMTPARVAFLNRVAREAKSGGVRASALLGLAQAEFTRADDAGEAPPAALEATLAEIIKSAPQSEAAAQAKKMLFVLKNLSIGKHCPDIRTQDLAGNPVQLSDYKGKVVILDFWATWCGFCVEMIPMQRELLKKYKGQVSLISISSDNSPNEVLEFQKTTPMPWTHWFNGPEGGLLESWQITGLPTIYILDAQGVIRGKDIHDAKQLDALLAKLVAEGGRR